MKRPFEMMRELVYDNVREGKEDIKRALEKIDSLMIWIVGFSIGGLSLIASDLTKFKEVYSFWLTKSILLMLVISIFFGIVFRIACYFIEVYHRSIQTYIETAFSDKEFMDFEAEHISDETDIKEVVRRLKVDFGEDYSNVLTHYMNLTDENLRLKTLTDLKEHYNKVANWARIDYQNSLEFVNDTLKKAYGYSDKQMKKLNKTFMSDEYTANKWKLSVRIAYISFALSTACFIASVITLAIAYQY